jgi:hypothetical protein
VEDGKDPAAKRRRLYRESAPSPSVEEIEADFWRIVEEPDQVQPIRTQVRFHRRSSSRWRAAGGQCSCVLELDRLRQRAFMHSLSCFKSVSGVKVC